MEVNMKYKKILIVTFILLVILSIGAVSASEDGDVSANDSDAVISQDNASIIEDNASAMVDDDNISGIDEGDDNDFIINLINANVADNGTVLIIPENQIPVDVDDKFSIFVYLGDYSVKETTWSINNLDVGVNGYEWTTNELLINELMEDIYPYAALDIYVQCYRNGEEAEQSYGSLWVYNTPFIVNDEVSLINDNRVVAFAYLPKYQICDEFYIETSKNGSLFNKKDLKISEMDQYMESGEYDGYYLHLSDLGINESGEYNLTIVFIKDLGEDVEKEYICYNGEFSVVSFPIVFYVREGEVAEDMTEPLCRIDLPEDCEGNVTVKVDGNKVFESTLEEIEYDGYDWGLSYYVILNSLNITESGEYNVEVTVETADWGTSTAEDTVSFNVTENIFEFRDSIYGESILDSHIGTAISRDSEIILYLNGNKAATGRFDDDLYFEFNESFADIYGSLKPGEYEAMMEIDGKNVAEGTFEVKDTSGNVYVDVTNDNCNVSVNFKAPMPLSLVGGYALDIYVDSANPYYLHGNDEPFLCFMYDELEELLDNNVHAIELGELGPGEHIVYVVYWTSLDYPLDEQDFFVRIFNITQPIGTELTVDDVNATLDSGKDIVATLSDVDGNAIGDAQVKITLNNITKELTTDAAGQVSISLDGLAVGSYIATFTFEGNEDYRKSNATANVVVNKATANITVRSAVSDDDKTVFKVKLTDGETGKGIAYYKVNLILDGNNLVTKTDKDGVAKFTTKALNTGNYSVTLKFAGTISRYAATTVTENVSVFKKVPVKLTVRSAVSDNNQSVFKVKLTDGETGKGIAYYKVNLILDGKNLVGTTDKNGVAKITAKALKKGDYTVTLKFAGTISRYNAATVTEKVSISGVPVKLTVRSAVSNNTNTIFKVKLTDGETGKGIAYYKVNLILDGDNLVAKTDKDGVAKFTTKPLQKGTYDVTLKFAGTISRYAATTVAQKVAVDGFIPAVIEVVSASSNSTASLFKIRLTDSENGDVLPNRKVNLILDGDNLVGLTDENGTAQITAKPLQKGAYNVTLKFAGTISRYCPTTVTQIVHINEIFVEMNVVSASSNNTASLFKIRLTDSENGDVLPNLNVTMILEGKTLTGTTDKNGTAQITANPLQKGKYNVTLKFAGTSTRYAATTVAQEVAVDGFIPAVIEVVSASSNSTASLFKIRLTDSENGDVLPNRKVNLILDGDNLVGLTDENGTAQITAKPLKNGTYSVTLKFAGTISRYFPTTVTQDVTIGKFITPSLTSDGVTAIYGDDDYLVVNLTGENKQPISGAKILFMVLGKNLTDVTDSYGQAKIPTKGYEPGIYKVVFKFSGDSIYSAVSSSAKITITKDTK